VETPFDDTEQTPVRFLRDAGQLYRGQSDGNMRIKCQLKRIAAFHTQDLVRARGSFVRHGNFPRAQFAAVLRRIALEVTMAARICARRSSSPPATLYLWPFRSAKVNSILLLAMDSAMLTFMGIHAAMRPTNLGQRPRVSNDLFCISTECCCICSVL
jgi:hypothetical protein